MKQYDPRQRHACVIIGEPGIGKSTLVEALTQGCKFEEFDKPFAHREYENGVTELGKRRPGGFGGTDALSLSVQPLVVDFLIREKPGLLLFEGDRLSNDSFFRSLRSLDYQLHLYELKGAALARERRVFRGSEQDEKWVKGRQTKTDRLSDAWNAKVVYASLPPRVLVQMLKDPVAEAFR